MKNFPRYLYKFIQYSFALNRKWLMVKTVAKLPVLRMKDYLRPVAVKLKLLKK